MFLKKFLGYETLETGVMMCTGMFLMLAVIVIVVNGPVFGKATRPPLTLLAIITCMSIIWIIAFIGALLSSKDVIKYVIVMWSSLVITWLILTTMLVIFKNRISCIPFGSRCAPTFWILGTDITLKIPPPTAETPDWPIGPPTPENTEQPVDPSGRTTESVIPSDPSQNTSELTTATGTAQFITGNDQTTTPTSSIEITKTTTAPVITTSKPAAKIKNAQRFLMGKVDNQSGYSTEKYMKNRNFGKQQSKTKLLERLLMHNLQYPIPPDSPPEFPPASSPPKKKKKPAKMWKENMAKSIPLLMFFTIVLLYSLYTLLSYYHQLNCIEECICTLQCSKPCNSESHKTCNRPPSRQC